MDNTQRIVGGPMVPASLLINYLMHWSPDTPHETAVQIASCYGAFGQLLNTGNLIPFAQAVHETGAFTSDWWKNAWNPAGLGVTGQAGVGLHFASPAEGIIAHVAHLVGYATAASAATSTQLLALAFDPRLKALGSKRGCAPTWAGLDGKWAVPGKGYSAKILQIASSIAATSG